MSARPGPCGGHSAMSVPTAISLRVGVIEILNGFSVLKGLYPLAARAKTRRGLT